VLGYKFRPLHILQLLAIWRPASNIQQSLGQICHQIFTNRAYCRALPPCLHTSTLSQLAPGPQRVSALCSESGLFVQAIPFSCLLVLPRPYSCVTPMTVVVDTPASDGPCAEPVARKEGIQVSSKGKSNYKRRSPTPQHLKRHKWFYMSEGNIIIQVWHPDEPLP